MLKEQITLETIRAADEFAASFIQDPDKLVSFFERICDKNVSESFAAALLNYDNGLAELFTSALQSMYRYRVDDSKSHIKAKQDKVNSFRKKYGNSASVAELIKFLASNPEIKILLNKNLRRILPGLDEETRVALFCLIDKYKDYHALICYIFAKYFHFLMGFNSRYLTNKLAFLPEWKLPKNILLDVSFSLGKPTIVLSKKIVQQAAIGRRSAEPSKQNFSYYLRMFLCRDSHNSWNKWRAKILLMSHEILVATFHGNNIQLQVINRAPQLLNHLSLLVREEISKQPLDILTILRDIIQNKKTDAEKQQILATLNFYVGKIDSIKSWRQANDLFYQKRIAKRIKELSAVKAFKNALIAGRGFDELRVKANIYRNRLICNLLVQSKKKADKYQNPCFLGTYADIFISNIFPIMPIEKRQIVSGISKYLKPETVCSLQAVISSWSADKIHILVEVLNLSQLSDVQKACAMAHMSPGVLVFPQSWSKFVLQLQKIETNKWQRDKSHYQETSETAKYRETFQKIVDNCHEIKTTQKGFLGYIGKNFPELLLLNLFWAMYWEFFNALSDADAAVFYRVLNPSCYISTGCLETFEAHHTFHEINKYAPHALFHTFSALDFETKEKIIESLRDGFTLKRVQYAFKSAFYVIIKLEDLRKFINGLGLPIKEDSVDPDSSCHEDDEESSSASESEDGSDSSVDSSGDSSEESGYESEEKLELAPEVIPIMSDTIAPAPVLSETDIKECQSIVNLLLNLKNRYLKALMMSIFEQENIKPGSDYDLFMKLGEVLAINQKEIDDFESEDEIRWQSLKNYFAAFINPDGVIEGNLSKIRCICNYIFEQRLWRFNETGLSAQDLEEVSGNEEELPVAMEQDSLNVNNDDSVVPAMSVTIEESSQDLGSLEISRKRTQAAEEAIIGNEVVAEPPSKKSKHECDMPLAQQKASPLVIHSIFPQANDLKHGDLLFKLLNCIELKKDANSQVYGLRKLKQDRIFIELNVGGNKRKFEISSQDLNWIETQLRFVIIHLAAYSQMPNQDDKPKVAKILQEYFQISYSIEQLCQIVTKHFKMSDIVGMAERYKNKLTTYLRNGTHGIGLIALDEYSVKDGRISVNPNSSVALVPTDSEIGALEANILRFIESDLKQDCVRKLFV